MKKTFTLLFALISLTCAAQTFNSPESVEYDAANSRWIVGQNGSGQIHIYSPASSTLSPFASGLSSGPHGLEIMGSTLYACDGNSIKGFDLSTGNQVFNLNLGATFLNGLTTDGSTYLFATDFSTKNIFRICPSAGTFNIMTTAQYTPNGIYYDGSNNRCVFVNWGTGARVQSLSLADSSITTLYTTTTSQIDGITRDPAGYWYITTWGGSALRRFDPNFSAAPVTVMSGLSGPADIDINTAGDSIGIPNSGNANNVVFYTNITTGVYSLSIIGNRDIYPNPVSAFLNVELEDSFEEGVLQILDMQGRIVAENSFTGNRTSANTTLLSNGCYILVVRSRQGEMILNEEIVVAH